MGSTLSTPHSSEENTVITKDYDRIESFLKDDIYVNNKVVIVGAGNTSYCAATLALQYEKQCRINGEDFEFTRNSKEKLSYLQTLLLIINQSNQEELFLDSSTKLISQSIKQCPSLYSEKVMKKMLIQAAPHLILDGGNTAKKHIITEFKARLKIRRDENIARLSVKIDNVNVFEKRMDYKDAVAFVLENPGTYALEGFMGTGKTEDFVKPIFNVLSESVRKVLLMTSTVSLTNALCSDHRNYKEALKNGTINDQGGIASCLYSALLSPAFKNFREACDTVIFEEYESCIDALSADIVGGKGTLEQKVKAQKVHNESLNKPTVILVDAHLSQQSIDHILARTNNRKIIVIKPLIEPKRKQKKITYHLHRNSAIQNIRNNVSNNKTGLTFSDCGHEEGGSKLKQLDNQINDGFDIKNIILDAAFFATGDNAKHMQNPTELINDYQHVLSTSVLRNGISIYSNVDLVTMICHKTISPLDVLQWSDRDRLNHVKSLFISKYKPYYSVNYTSVFEDELKKGIKSVDVADTRDLLNDEDHKDAKDDIINRILYNNVMRDDYANNLLCMFDILAYEISYDYSEPTEEIKEGEKKAISEERQERLAICAMLDQFKHSTRLNQIRAKDKASRTLDERRITYADDVYYYYNIDNKSEDFEEVFDFDSSGAGRNKLNNFSLAIEGFESDYYTSHTKEIILKKFFECLNINRNLNGAFTPDDYKKFHKYVHNENIDLYGNSEKVLHVIKTLFKSLNTDNPTSLCKGLLQKAFGLSICDAKRDGINKKGKKVKVKYRKNNPARDYFKCISDETASQLLKFYKMANPYFDQSGVVIKKSFNSVIDKTPEFEMSIMEVNMIAQDFEKEENLTPFTESSKQKESDDTYEEETDNNLNFKSLDEAIEYFDKIA